MDHGGSHKAVLNWLGQRGQNDEGYVPEVVVEGLHLPINFSRIATLEEAETRVYPFYEADHAERRWEAHFALTLTGCSRVANQVRANELLREQQHVFTDSGYEAAEFLVHWLDSNDTAWVEFRFVPPRDKTGCPRDVARMLGESLRDKVTCFHGNWEELQEPVVLGYH